MFRERGPRVTPPSLRGFDRVQAVCKQKNALNRCVRDRRIAVWRKQRVQRQEALARIDEDDETIQHVLRGILQRPVVPLGMVHIHIEGLVGFAPLQVTTFVGRLGFEPTIQRIQARPQSGSVSGCVGWQLEKRGLGKRTDVPAGSAAARNPQAALRLASHAGWIVRRGDGLRPEGSITQAGHRLKEGWGGSRVEETWHP
jgi:hypothetical protein